MTKWKFFLSVLCSFVAGALVLLVILLDVLVYTPRTTKLDYTMRGFIISADGEVLEEFTMTATGEEYDSIIDRPNGENTFSGTAPVRIEKDTFYLDIDWSASTILTGNTPGLFTRDFCIPHTRFIFGDLFAYSSDIGLMVREYGIFDPDSGVFYLYADELAENVFILGITDPDADPLVVLKAYQSVEGLLHRPELLPPTEN